MSRQWWITTLLVIALLSLSIVPPLFTPDAEAQGPLNPLVILKDGDFWAWTPDGVLTQITSWGYNESPVLSPDGRRIAYVSWAQIAVDALAAGVPVMGFIPTNIWILDPVTGDAVRAADQPAEAGYTAEGIATNAIMRGKPSWSPDGTKLAWGEVTAPDFVYRLVVYDVATTTSTVIVPSLPYPFADAGYVPVHEVKWGWEGIALTNAAYNEASGEFEDRLYVYRDDGSPVSETVVGSSSTEFLFDFHWAEFGGQNVIGLLYRSGKSMILDPVAGTTQELPAPMEAFSGTATGPTVRLIPQPSADETGSVTTVWTAFAPDGAAGEELPARGSDESVTISPDGQIAGFVSDAVYIWNNGQTTIVPGTEGVDTLGQVAVLWGPLAWHIPTGEEVQAEAAALAPEATGQGGGQGGAAFAVCSPAPRLTVGGSGQVTPGLPNVLRSLPRRGPDSVILGQIPGGGVFTVLAGPQCDFEGRYWWQVNYNGIVGWTPEGQGLTYWLQPYTGSIVCSPTPRLTIGTSAYVLPGLPNLMRARPGTGMDNPIVGKIPGGAFFTVLNGPQCGNDGRYWWQVSYAGLTGWTAEGQGNEYWTAPFGCPNSPRPRLYPGIQGQVTPGDPNTLRAAPGTGYGAVGQIPGGGVFTVLSGPQCGAEGWTWWRVNYAGIVGWTAEGQGSTYWLQPYSGTTPTPPPPIACNLPARLTVGASGRVTPGDPNVLRAQPRRGSDSAILGYIPGGGVFTVLAGPHCDIEGMHWWQVNYNGLVGWTPEGQGSTYWLEPLGITPTPVNTPIVGCSPAPRLTAGISAFVTPGASNVMRNNPGTANTVVIGQIPGGAFFRVIGGPQCGNDGRYWWMVNYQGMVGWTAEGEGSVYWVSPFVCSGSLPSRLVPGIAARVTPGDPNVIRDQPGTGSVIGQIPGGGVFTVVSGPQCDSQGRIWWRVNYNGLVGWTAEGQGGMYWTEPLGG